MSLLRNLQGGFLKGTAVVAKEACVGPANLHIRRYQPDDFPDVWDLHIEGLEATGTNPGDGPDQDDLRDITGTYLNGTGEFLVGELDDRVIVMGGLQKVKGSDGMAEIKRMRVSPAFWRRGYGEVILGKLEEAARRLKYRYLVLSTTEYQIAAQKLYLKSGFREDRREINTLRGREWPMVCFIKTL